MDGEINIIARRQYKTIILTGIGIAILFHPVVTYLVLNKSILPFWRLIISTVLTWATLPVLYQYALKVEERDFLLWKEQRRNVFFYPLCIIILFILAFCAEAISNIPHRLGFHDDYTVMRYWGLLIRKNTFALFFICISAGATEELLVRGYILPRLTLLFKSKWVPVMLTSLLFSILHLGYSNLSECIFTFLFGLMCALYYMRYQSISVLILFHFLFDLQAFLR